MSPEFQVIAALWGVAAIFLTLVFSEVFAPDQRHRTDTQGLKETQSLIRGFAVLAGVGMLVFFAQPGNTVLAAKILDNYTLTVAGASSYLALYACVGLVWSVVYFYLYARRLGMLYVMERDLWMRTHELTSLEGLSSDLRTHFAGQVLEKVKREMIYEGDFPLRPLQQKRFFGANLFLWPATLLYYVLGDMTVDIARRVWFTFRKWIHSYWEKGMTEYLADDALCAKYMATEQGSQ